MHTLYAQVAQEDSTATSPFTYTIQGNLVGSRLSGTFNQLAIAPSADVRLEVGKWHFHNALSYRYNQFNGLLIESNWRELITVGYYPRSPRLFPFAFYTFDTHLIFQINRRHSGGLGIGSTQEWKGQRITLGVGAGFDNTIYNGDTFENSPAVNSLRERNLFIVRLLQTHPLLDGKMTITNDTFYSHSLRERSDYVIIISPKLSWNIYKGLALTGSFQYRLENVHLTALTRVNTVTAIGLSYSASNK